MPTVVATEVKGFAHCRDARCPGYQQQEVDAVREESSQTFGENGGDGPFLHMIERSSVEFRFKDSDDVPCPVCSQPREVSETPRPQYQPLSGHDPMGLLSVAPFDPGKVPEVVESDEAVEARVRQRLKEEQIEARLRKEMEG